MNPQNSILENTRDSKDHQTLMVALKVVQLGKVLGNDVPFTVFVPSDNALKNYC